MLAWLHLPREHDLSRGVSGLSLLPAWFCRWHYLSHRHLWLESECGIGESLLATIAQFGTLLQRPRLGKLMLFKTCPPCLVFEMFQVGSCVDEISGAIFLMTSVVYSN